ncbi:MAG: MFS transporter [Deltaproteobacteria bacterium]|nr:MAG: MFS transporter [Deltaproteobacteria bacterium]
MAKKLIYGNREHWAWYLYDFGNSAYAAVVVLAVYSAYFKGAVVGGAQGTRLWGISVGIAMLISVVISIIMGPIADFSASKKKFLFGFSALSWIFTALLFFVTKGDIFIGMLFYILAEVGYRIGQVFYNGLLPEITTAEDLGRVSGNGWAIGSMGGIVCLLIVLPIIMIFKNSDLPVRLAMVITAVFFAASTIPSFLIIKERAQPQRLLPGQNYLTVGFKRLGKTLKNIRHFKEFVKFMIAFLVFNDGIMMAMDFAAIIGAVLYGMNQTQLIVMMIIVQVTSIFGAYLSGIYGEKVGFKRALMISLALMLLAIIWMLFNQTLIGYFVITALAGFALTGVQAVSRTMTGFFAPKGQSAEFYSFESVAGRASSFVGPTIYGLLAGGVAIWLEKNRGMETLLAEQVGQRAGIISIGVFLVIGMLILTTVNEKRGRQAAEAYVQEGTESGGA